jgi:chromosome segregation ATPase
MLARGSHNITLFNLFNKFTINLTLIQYPLFVQLCFQNLTEKNEDNQSKLEAGQEALSLLEEYKVLEVQLREQVASLEAAKIEEVTKLTTELVEKDRKLDSDVTSYKEQIKQHSVTICAMEERISKVMKKNKECIEEAEAYRKQIQGKSLILICFSKQIY